MKKIFTLFIALISFSVLFAQRNSSYNNYPSNNWNTTDKRHYNDRNDDYYNNRTDHAVVIRDDRYQHNDCNYNDNYRRKQMENINRDYDRRINDYRYNRKMNAYERQRQIEILQRERNDKLKAFGGGVLIGGILGVLLGSQL